MGHLGIVSRIALIVTVALFLSQIAVVATYLSQVESTPLPPRAISERIVAVVRLIDQIPLENRPEALEVANATGFHVAIIPSTPASFHDDISVTRIRMVAEASINNYAPGRFVRAGSMLSPDGHPDELKIVLVVELKSGEVALFTMVDNTTLRIWDLPIGFLAGFFGFVVALIAVLAVARETRPLAKLARNVDELGNRILPIQVEERGAREIRVLIQAINEMQGRILSLISNRTLFLGAISHDLKTYLTRFRLRLEIMPTGAHKDRAVRDVEAMEQLLNDVLLFANESSLCADAETVDLRKAVQRGALEANSGTYCVEVVDTSEVLNVRIPNQALDRVVDNLLSNAVRYGETAKVTAERRGNNACFIIDDNGPGIPEQDLELVFEPFFRGEPSRNRTHGGTGLGLAIVRQILEAHGGTITLANRSTGRGLRACVILPLADSPHMPFDKG